MKKMLFKNLLITFSAWSMLQSGEAGVLNVQEFESHGIKYILAEDHSIANINLGISFSTGASLEASEKAGLTRLMMELMLRGTKRHSKSQLDEATEFIGSSIDPNIGFSTMTMGGETLTRHRDTFAGLLSEILIEPTLSADELEKLKKETLDLLRLALDDDSSLGRRHYQEAAYSGHLYGRSITGYEKTIKAIQIQDIRDYYSQVIRKGNATIFAAGDIDRAGLQDLGQKFFAALPEGKFEAPDAGPATPLKGRNLVIVDKPSRSQIQLFIGHPTIKVTDPSFYPLTLINTAFGGFFQSRYSTEIRIKNGWTYGASSSLDLNQQAGLFTMRTFMEIKNLEPAVRKSLQMLSELSQDGLTSEELSKAKSSLIKQFPFKIDTADKRIQQRLFIMASRLPKDYLDTYRTRIEAVDLGDVKQAAKRHLNGDNVVITAVCEAAVCRPLLEKAIDKLASVKVVPYDTLN